MEASNEQFNEDPEVQLVGNSGGIEKSVARPALTEETAKRELAQRKEARKAAMETTRQEGGDIDESVIGSIGAAGAQALHEKIMDDLINEDYRKIEKALEAGEDPYKFKN